MLIAKARVVTFAIGAALILALLVCFAADLLGLYRDLVGQVFPKIAVFLVYDAAATLVFRAALALSIRHDRAR